MVEEKRPDQLVKMHFYDIECLNNIFTLTNYYPEENKVVQYVLPDKKLGKIMDSQPDFMEKLTARVRLRNKNFTPGKITKSLGSGTVEVRDLRTTKANLQLAREFGMSTARNPNDPTDTTSVYPASFRLICDTDEDNKTGYWRPEEVMKRYNSKLFMIRNMDSDTMESIQKIDKSYPNLDKLNYHYYNAKNDPFLLGYNSANYDLTMLAIYLQEAFVTTENNPDQAELYAQNGSGFHFYKINAPEPNILRKINNELFTTYRDRMPSILFNPPEGQERDSYRRAYLIRRNMLRSGRHLDVSNLNAKMRKVGLKRLLGMLGYQILESSQLKPGTDHLDSIEQIYELLAYNASDCINLACLMDHPYYQGQFQLMQTMLHTYPMIVYQKKDKTYAPEISPATVKPNRMRIDSSSADVATNVVCPYGHLKDIPHTSFNYPEARKSVEVKIPQFNVLEQTKDFFEKRVYGPAAKINLIAANEAKEQFDRIMHFYATVQNKNFDDSTNFYIDQLAPYNKDKETLKALKNLKDQDFIDMFSHLNTFDLKSIRQYKGIQEIHVAYNGYTYNIPRHFVLNNKLVPDTKDKRVITLGDLVGYIKDHSRGDKTKHLNEVEQLLALYNKNQKSLQQTNVADVFNSVNTNQNGISNEDFNTMKKLVEFITDAVFKKTMTLQAPPQPNAAPSQLIILENNKPLRKLTMRPYVTKDLPVDNYCLPFFNADGTPSAGYALFSIGGIHGAEYNKDLYDEDEAVYEREMTMNASFGGKNTSKIKAPILFKPNKSGAYALNDKYVYTSIDWANHEDFSSYYPSLCRMLNVYWNDGIGRDIYGEVYDRKEELGHMMKDTKKYSADEREYFHIMRQGTKLILNSTTGKGDTHGQNSPIQMNNNIISMRLIGQMFTWRIGQAQTLAGAKVISTNTDGLYTVMDDIELNSKILENEVKEIHVRIDPERLYLISKDANNRIEEDAKTFEINTPSGGDLAAFNGPVPTHSLAHPAAVDKALGLYLQEIGKPDSPYYDKKLMKPFNSELGMKLLLRLKPIDNTDPDTLEDKRKRLNYYQNVVASQPGSDRYIFTSDEYFADPNDELYTHINLGKDIVPQQEHREEQLSLSLWGDDDLDVNKIHIIQHYNRIFYLKADSNLPYQFLYVAAGRKVPANIRASRMKNNQILYDNGTLASYVLSKNGVAVNGLNQEYKEAKVVKMPSSQPEWPIIIVNQSLASLSEQEINNLINNLDMNVYLDMLKQKYMHSWCNNPVYKHDYDKEKAQKTKELQRIWENRRA